MRKCKVFEWCSDPDAVDDPEKMWKAPLKRYEVGEGLFHRWGVSFEEFEGGPGNFTTAIVEMQDGTIVEVMPAEIQFLEPNSRAVEGPGGLCQICLQRLADIEEVSIPNSTSEHTVALLGSTSAADVVFRFLENLEIGINEATFRASWEHFGMPSLRAEDQER